MNIHVTGGCGYKGTVLVPKLLNDGHHVTVVDLMWFGNYLESNSNLKIKRLDVREIDKIQLDNIDVIIHLASVANDPCAELDARLSWEISCLSTMQLASKASVNGVKQFIYASSGSVYGVKQEKQVTEELTPVPISEYNKAKMVAERVLLSYAPQMAIQIIRPATVCGLSPRMRLDVSVNMLTMQAINKGEITVFGGDQTRPNIHIQDITDIYLHMLKNPNLVGIFNAGFENLSISTIADLAAENSEAKIKTLASNDPRSYRINSDKLLKTGFNPRKNVGDAIAELKLAFKENKLQDKEEFYNLKWMTKTIFKTYQS